MKKQIEFEWEKLPGGSGVATYRAKVIGGWLISSCKQTHDGGVALTFIPDKNYEWEIKK